MVKVLHRLVRTKWETSQITLSILFLSFFSLLFKRYFIETIVLSMEEGHSSLKPHLSELFRDSQYARNIQDTTQPILEEFSTSLHTVEFPKEREITYATSFCSQVGGDL